MAFNLDPGLVEYFAYHTYHFDIGNCTISNLEIPADIDIGSLRTILLDF